MDLQELLVRVAHDLWLDVGHWLGHAVDLDDLQAAKIATHGLASW